MPTDTTGGGTVAVAAVSTTTTLAVTRGSESDLLGKLLGGLIASVESLVTLEVVTIVSALEVHHEMEDGKVRRWRARPPAAGAVEGAASSINLVTGDIRAVVSERMLEPDRAALLAQHQGYVVEGRKIVADNLKAMMSLARDLKADLRR